jgi:nucleotide-binding universal stress UspA family protein
VTETPAPRSEAVTHAAGPILAGVMPGQHPVVLDHAAAVAAGAGLPLVCAYADVTMYPVDGTTGGPAAPIDPDAMEEDLHRIPESLMQTLRDQLDGKGVEWSLVHLAGEPARALAREAEDIGASIIVVGTREHKLTAALKELTAGSVARHLFHRQGRPVLVVPVNPRVTTGDDDE